MDIVDLVAQLNTLLLSLHLPFTLESPTDLTPSLLLAILESLLGVRLSLDLDTELGGGDPGPGPLPISPEAKRTRHIQIIKVFLGVLETDVFKADVGLSGIDPRLLASGAWDEVVFVAEILCWIGREVGLVPSHPRRSSNSLNKGKAKELAENESEDEWLCEEPEQASSPLTSQSNLASASPSSTITFLPPFSSPLLTQDPTTSSLLFTESTSTFNDNDDTIHTLITSPRATSSPILIPSTLPHSDPSSSRTPPSSLLSRTSTSSISSSSRKRHPSVRQTGYISLVDHDAEISTFLSHSLNLSSPSSTTSSALPPPTTPVSRHRRPTTPRAHPGSTTLKNNNNNARQDWLTLIATNPDYDPHRTLQLLQQRTRLMEELLQLRMGTKPTAK